jgi:hypothetical protein
MDAPESATARTRRELLRPREDARAIKGDQARARFGEQEEPPEPALVPPAGEASSGPPAKPPVGRMVFSYLSLLAR